MSDQHQGSSGLFAIFFISLYTLFLVVYSCYHFCASGDEQTSQPVVKVCVDWQPAAPWRQAAGEGGG